MNEYGGLRDLELKERAAYVRDRARRELQGTLKDERPRRRWLRRAA
jgi:hypothetical protein